MRLLHHVASEGEKASADLALQSGSFFGRREREQSGKVQRAESQASSAASAGGGGWGMPAPPPGARITFQVSAPLGHGQTLYLVGDVPALGGSIDVVPNPVGGSDSASGGNSNGLALVTTPELFPVWYTSAPVVVPAGSIIHYRYAVCSGSKFLRYETIVVRELVVGMDDMQTLDTLDSDKIGSFNAIPRLSSGEAFMDRRANDIEESGGTGSIWTLRSNAHKRSTSRLLSPSIPEETPTAIRTHSSSSVLNDEDVQDVQVAPESPMARLPPVPIGFSSTPSLSSPSTSALQRTIEESARPVLSSPVQTSRARSYSEESIKSPQNVTIESTDGVIIVVYRLPVLVHRTPEGNYVIEWEDDNLVCPSGLLKQTNNASQWDRVNSMRLTWVGTVHCSSVIPREDEERLARQLEEFHCIPVFLSESLAQTFHSFCYGTLWPIFHNIVDVYGRLPTRWWNPNQQKNAWSSYKNVNRIFVNKVIEVYNDGDLVWVHGLHLLVAPSFLSRRLPCVNVGLFVHTPFPSSEIFRTLSVRADLLRGMLSSDHIGFHLYEHARHFLTSCRRILGLKYSAQPGGYIGIEYNGRMVMLTICHIGIEPPFMQQVYETPQVIDDYRELTTKYETDKRTVIVSVDRVERLKGILLKLGAIEYFLSTYPEWIDKLQVIQVGIVDTSNPSEEKAALQAELAGSVERINTRFANGRKEPIIVYSEVENTDLASRLPLWRLGDVMLTTSVRDAVNLYPFEFIYAHELAGKAGVVIVSEFSGSSRVLTGSIGINPWKREEIVKSILLAVTMPEKERTARHQKDLEYITNNSRTKWAERILVDLKRTKKVPTQGEYMGYGLGLGFRMLEFNAGFKMLDTEAVAKAYRSSFHRVILLDYGNTLTLSESGSNDFSKYLVSGCDKLSSDGSVVSKSDTPAASPELLSALSLLCADPRNTVFVLSGKERGDLEKTLGSVRGLGLAAEHGYLYKWGDSRSVSFGDSENVWLCTKDNFDDSWKDITHSVMDIYTQRTHGTYVELKGSALLWQYRDADPEFGQLQAKELHDQLTQVLEHFQVVVLAGNDYLEVRPEGVDKGVIVDRIMSTIESTSGNYADFILCIGDDQSDEFMFQYLEDQRTRPKLFTVTVGKKPSAAKYFVNDVDQVMEVLHSLTKVSTSANRNLSMNDLRMLDRTHLPLSSDLLSFGRNAPSSLGYQSEGSVENFQISSFSSLPVTPTSASASSTVTAPGGGTNSLLRGRHSMSMSALSSAAYSAPTSSTYEQYFSNIDESEEDQGGIFF